MPEAKKRTGARTFLNDVRHACKMSHMPGFRNGLTNILGPDGAADLYSLWTPFCALVESIIVLDDWFNLIDATAPSEEGGEDVVVG